LISARSTPSFQLDALSVSEAIQAFPFVDINSLSSSAALKQAPLARQLVSISTEDRRMVIAERSLIGQFAQATSRLQLHLMEPMTL
jgi:hypothetical protein